MTYAAVMRLEPQTVTSLTSLQAPCELAKEELVKAQEVSKSYFDKIGLRLFEPGDRSFILLSAEHKLLSQGKGPYELVQCISDAHYVVQIGSLSKWIQFKLLKKNHTPTKFGCISRKQGQLKELTTVTPASGKPKGDMQVVDVATAVLATSP